MSDDPPQVDWSLLPLEPRQFFGVGRDFSRSELKQRYNRLIRHYKPEKYPDEFQRIRAAYEELEHQRRYGDPGQRTADGAAEDVWPTDESTDPRVTTPDDRAPPTTSARDDLQVLRERIEAEPLVRVYQDVVAQPNKTPSEYYALAVISDLLHEQGELRYLHWILSGLREHPTDPGLSKLLHEYLRSPIPLDAIEAVLGAVSAAVQDDSFFALTEVLWKRLFESCDFAEFRRILDQSTAKLSDLQIDGKLIFSVELLKCAIWTADSDWVEQTASFIDQHFDRLAPHFEFDLDVLDLVRKYIAHRDNFCSGHPLRQQIDQAIEDYFKKSQVLGDQSVLACQARIAQNQNEVLEAFGYEFEIDDRNTDFFALWNYIAADVAARHVVEGQRPDLAAWGTRGRAVFERIDRKVGGSRVRFGWEIANGAYLTMLGVLYFGTALTLALTLTIASLSFDHREAVVVGVMLASIIGGLLFARRIHLRYLWPRRQKYRLAKSIQAYVAYSRIELAEFLQRTHFSYYELRELLARTSIANLMHAQSTFDHYQRDYGLAIYGMSLAFRA